MLGMIGASLPEDYRATLSSLLLFDKEGTPSLLPSPQRLASLHKFLVRRFVDNESLLLTSEQRVMVDSGVWIPSEDLFPIQRGTVFAARTLSEWVEDSHRTLAEEDESHIAVRTRSAVASSEIRLNGLSGRIGTMLPLLLTTLGSATSDGGLFIMPKKRAEMLAGYFLKSLDETARAAMRFRDPKPVEKESPEDTEPEKKDTERKLESFPKLMEGVRRLKSITRDDDGSDLVVERLLSSIDSLFLEALTTYACKKSVSEVARRKKRLREKANDTQFSAKQALLEILKRELDRLYAVQERSCRAFSTEDAPEKNGYSPFLFLNSDDNFEPSDDERLHLSFMKKKKLLNEMNLEDAFYDILTADRGLFAVPRIRSRGFPSILFLPGNAVGAYDKTGDILLLPFSALKERSLEHLLNAFASFRWACDTSGKILNMWSDLIGSRGAKQLLELEASFRRAYSSWVMHEISGGTIDERAEAVGAVLRPEGAFTRHSA